MECEPGEEAQIDFGQAAPVIDSDGKRRRPHVLRVVLSHSRKGCYSEAVDRQTTENFIRCLENAFRHIGGVPKTLVIDNLRAAVQRGGCRKCAKLARKQGVGRLPCSSRGAWPEFA